MSIDRRTFLKIGGVGLFGVSFAPLLIGCEEHIITSLGELASTPLLTPQADFFVQHGGEGSIDQWSLPDIAQSTWQMVIEQRPTRNDSITQIGVVSFQDLLDARSQEIVLLKTMQCVLESPVRLTPTGYTGTAYWTGIPLTFFLDRLGLDLTKFKRLRLFGADGFTDNIPVERILNAEADGLVQPLLVYQMNGTPLTREHGFPVRLIVQEGFGYRNIKWITRMLATYQDDPFGTYQDEGFIDDGVMRVNSRSTDLRENISIPAGPTEITGVAMSGYAPISVVAISIDGGEFKAAEIIPLDEIQQTETLPPNILQIAQNLPYPFKAVWVKWRYQWEASAGTHTVVIRATDTAGNTQPLTDDDIYDGQNGVTRYTVKVG